MPLVEWICIRPGDAATLTIVANKCSIVRNAPCSMNMHPPRWCWYTNPRRQQVLHCPKCPWPNKYASAPTSTPFFFPDPSTTVAARPYFPAIAHMSHYAVLSGGARARSRVQGCRSNRNQAAFHWSRAQTMVWLGWWRGGRKRKVKTTVVFISSVQRTQWVVCCVSQIWVRVLMCFWFCSAPRIVDFIISKRSISRCWRMLASLVFDCRTGQTR
jgi:hypothetical protein